MHPVTQEGDYIIQFDLMIRQAQHEIQRLTLIPPNRIAVEIDKDQHDQNRRPLVAIDKGMVQDQRMKQRCCLVDQIWIGINAQSAGLRSGDS